MNVRDNLLMGAYHRRDGTPPSAAISTSCSGCFRAL
jgi:hypothetical protein